MKGSMDIFWNIVESEPMRVLASSTLYIEPEKRVIFPIVGLKGSGIVSMAPKLSLFRNYMEKTNELPGIWLPTTFLSIILSCGHRGRGVGVFVGLWVCGSELDPNPTALVLPLLNGISC